MSLFLRNRLFLSQVQRHTPSMRYKLLGIQRVTETCITVFLHREFLSACFQSKLSKWCYRAHSQCKVSVWGFFTLVSLDRKINFCFGSQVSSQWSQWKMSLLSVWLRSGELSASHYAVHFSNRAGVAFYGSFTYFAPPIQVRTPKISILISW